MYHIVHILERMLQNIIAKIHAPKELLILIAQSLYRVYRLFVNDLSEDRQSCSGLERRLIKYRSGDVM